MSLLDRVMILIVGVLLVSALVGLIKYDIASTAAVLSTARGGRLLAVWPPGRAQGQISHYPEPSVNHFVAARGGVFAWCDYGWGFCED